MSNRYGNFTPLSASKRSQMAKDAWKTRKATHIDVNAECRWFRALSPREQRLYIKKAESNFNIFSLTCLFILISIPCMFFFLFG